MISVIRDWTDVSIEVSGDAVRNVQYRIVREVDGTLLQEVCDQHGKPIASGRLDAIHTHDERFQRFNLILILADATHIMCRPV